MQFDGEVGVDRRLMSLKFRDVMLLQPMRSLHPRTPYCIATIEHFYLRMPTDATFLLQRISKFSFIPFSSACTFSSFCSIFD